MSIAKRAAERLMAWGAATRPEWSAQADTAHYRVYKWWIKSTEKTPLNTENFCRYWRIVLVWAPLLWLRPALIGLLIMTGLTGVALAIVKFTDNAIGMAIVAAFGVYLIFCVKVGEQLLYDLGNRETLILEPVPWLDDKTMTAKAAMTLLALPGLIFILPMLAVFITLLIILVGLSIDYDVYGRSWRWLTNTHYNRSKWVSWIRPWLTIPAGLIGLSFLHKEATTIALVLAGAATLVVLLAGVIGYRRRRYQQEMYHYLGNPTDDSPIIEGMATLMIERDSEPQQGSWPVRTLRAAVTSVGEYLGLIRSAILTAKWKLVCPRVELPPD